MPVRSWNARTHRKTFAPLPFNKFNLQRDESAQIIKTERNGNERCTERWLPLQHRFCTVVENGTATQRKRNGDGTLTFLCPLLYTACALTWDSLKFYNSRTQHDMEMKLASIAFSPWVAEDYRSSWLQTLGHSPYIRDTICKYYLNMLIRLKWMHT